jgi:predicted esterase
MNDLGFIHRFVPAPAGLDAPRTLLMLHGTGGNENDLLDLGRAIDPRAAILSPRGQVLENGAPRFFRRLAEGVFDEADVVARSHELAAFVAEAIRHYKIDPAQMVAVGYSNGANIAAAMVLLGLAEFPKAILFRAMVPLSSPAPVTAKTNGILISEGRFDQIAHPDQGAHLERLLQQTGAKVDLIFQTAGHELIGSDVAAAQQWLVSVA